MNGNKALIDSNIIIYLSKRDLEQKIAGGVIHVGSDPEKPPSAFFAPEHLPLREPSSF
jgi:hypothetical protein